MILAGSHIDLGWPWVAIPCTVVHVVQSCLRWWGLVVRGSGDPRRSSVVACWFCWISLVLGALWPPLWAGNIIKALNRENQLECIWQSIRVQFDYLLRALRLIKQSKFCANICDGTKLCVAIKSLQQFNTHRWNILEIWMSWRSLSFPCNLLAGRFPHTAHEYSQVFPAVPPLNYFFSWDINGYYLCTYIEKATPSHLSQKIHNRLQPNLLQVEQILFIIIIVVYSEK